MLFSLSISVLSPASGLTSGWALERELKNLGLLVGPGGGRSWSSSSSDWSSGVRDSDSVMNYNLYTWFQSKTCLPTE